MALASGEQVARQLVVVVHHELTVGLHGVAASAFMKHRFHAAVVALGKTLIKLPSVLVVGDVQVGQVAKFVAVAQIVHRNDVGDAAQVQALDDVAADEAGRASDNDAHGCSLIAALLRQTTRHVTRWPCPVCPPQSHRLCWPRAWLGANSSPRLPARPRSRSLCRPRR